MGMPVVRAEHDRSGDLPIAVAIICVGLGMLLLRRSLLGTAQQVPLLIEIYIGLAVISIAVPMPGGHGRRLPEPAVLAIGVSAFVSATILVRPPNLMAHGPEILVLNSLAAFSEEAFFRRFVYGVLERRGAVLAIAGAACLFAAVHIPSYGPSVFWIDLGAGLVLGWQRWASGSWLSCGTTHAIANLLAVLR
jgi:membrane protease YdiL (CAAX protease family)